MSDTVKIGPFINGANNIADERTLPDGSARKLLNVDVDDQGNICKRKGFTLVHSGADIHSLYKGYFIEGTDLKHIDSAFNVTSIRSGLSGKRVSYCILNDEILYSDSGFVERVDGSDFGVEDPANPPTLTATNGSLSPGKYQASVLFRDINTGEMSGATNPVTIDLTTTGGIMFSNIPQPQGSYEISVYLSDTDGAKMYYVGTYPKGITTTTVPSHKKNKHEIPTLNLIRMVGGDILRYFKGRLYAALGNVLYFSEPHRYGLIDHTKNFVPFPAEITVVQPVDDGMYIVADKTYFLAGANPLENTLTEVSDATGIKHTGIEIDAGNFNLEGATGEAAYWYGSKGGVIGLPGGRILEYSKDRLSVPVDAINGTTMYSEEDGIHKLVSVISTAGSGTKSSIGASDNVTVQHIRNGVILT